MVKFKKLDHVYYINRCGDTIPAVVFRTKGDRAYIGGDFLEGERWSWVKQKNLKLQTEDRYMTNNCGCRVQDGDYNLYPRIIFCDKHKGKVIEKS